MGQMALDGVSLTQPNDRSVESAEQDQTSHACVVKFGSTLSTKYTVRTGRIRVRWFVIDIQGIYTNLLGKLS